MVKKRSDIIDLKKMSQRLPILTIIRRLTTLEITLSEKTNCSFGNFYIGNY